MTSAFIHHVTPQLYHWAPTDRRPKIKKYGLRPNQPPTTSTLRQRFIAFGTDPFEAWKLSGGMRWNAHIPIWDLWMLHHLTEADVLHDYQTPGEVRVCNRIYKRRIWLVATRSVDTGGNAR